jgi:hypothetical protein
VSGCKTGKLRYRDENAARVVLVASRFRRAVGRGKDRREERVYQCQFCLGWHLTSTPFRPKKGAA